MREIFLQIVYGRSQTAFSEGGLPVGASLDDLGKGLRSQVGTMFGTKAKGARYLELAQGYVTRMALNDKNEIIAFEFLNLGKFTDASRPARPPRRPSLVLWATMVSGRTLPSTSTRAPTRRPVLHWYPLL